MAPSRWRTQPQGYQLPNFNRPLHQRRGRGKVLAVLHRAYILDQLSASLPFSRNTPAPQGAFCNMGPKLDRVLKVPPNQSEYRRRTTSLDLLIQVRMSSIFSATWAHTGSHSAGCQPEPPHPFMIGIFPATLPQACNTHEVVVAKV